MYWSIQSIMKDFIIMQVNYEKFRYMIVRE
jgi:hypothetical protein